MSDVSAVVVNHDGDAGILRCLEELRALVPPLAELVVVDSGSSDGSPDAIRERFPEVELVEMGENVGPAVARNVGLRRARSPLVLFVDDDVYLAPGCLERLLACRRAREATAVAPRLVLLPGSTTIQADGADVHFTGTMRLRHGRAPVDAVPAETRAIGAFSTSCVLVDRARVLAAGGFDESFFIYQEDMELSLRLRTFGDALFCDSAAVAFHDRGEGTPGLSFRDEGAYPRRRAYLTLRNRLRMVLLHYHLRTLVVLAPALALYELASIVLAIRRGWIGAWARAWLWQIGHLPLIVRRRRWIQRTRRVDDARLLVGGTIPLAPGVLRSALARRAVDALSSMLDGYWRLCRPLVPGAAAARRAAEEAA